MGTFKHIAHQTPLLQLPQSTVESNVWKSGYNKPPLVRREPGQIKAISFSPDLTMPLYAVASGTKVFMYGEPPEWERVKTFTAFTQPVNGGHFRYDGRLFTCGCDDGIVRAFDITTGVVLRQFQDKESRDLPVRSAVFSRDGLRIASAGDDKTLKIWDLGVGQLLNSFSEHTDSIRTVCPLPTDSSVWITASYDKTVRFFDNRVRGSVRTIECPSLVETVSISSSGVSLAIASDRSVIIYDAVSASDRPMAVLSNHHKTVTSLAFSKSDAYLLSGSFDKHVKVIDMEETNGFQVVASLDYPEPIIQVAPSIDDRFLLVAMNDGKLSLSTRKQQVDYVKPVRVGNLKPSRYFERVIKNVHTEGDDSLAKVIGGSKVSVIHTEEDLGHCGAKRYYDKMLQKFEHSKALTAVMKDAFRRHNVDVAVSVIDELIRRNVLRIALAGRPEDWLSKSLRFAGNQYHHIPYQRVLSEFVNAMVDVYGDALVGSDDPELRKSLRYVCEVVDTEWSVKLHANELMGAVECLLSQQTLSSVE